LALTKDNRGRASYLMAPPLLLLLPWHHVGNCRLSGEQHCLIHRRSMQLLMSFCCLFWLRFRFIMSPTANLI